MSRDVQILVKCKWSPNKEGFTIHFRIVSSDKFKNTFRILQTNQGVGEDYQSLFIVQKNGNLSSISQNRFWSNPERRIGLRIQTNLNIRAPLRKKAT